MNTNSYTSAPTAGRVLIVEDDGTARALMAAVVEAGHLEAVHAADAEEVLEKVAGGVDLILLDMKLPGVGGLDICRRLRRDGVRVPIIMVSSLTDTVDAVVALEVGADDYVRKPFDARELNARINRQLRRREERSTRRESAVLEFPGLRIDTASRRVWRDEVEVNLTIIEFDFLRALAEDPDMVVSRRDLMRRVWGRDVSDTRTIDAHIYRLRRKIEPDSSVPTYVHNIAGVGYRLGVRPLRPQPRAMPRGPCAGTETTDR